MSRSGTIVEQAARMRGMSPRPRNEIPDDLAVRLAKVTAAKAVADAEHKAAVLAALDAGGSVRRVADLAGLSPTTVQNWKAER
jgi:hypothetical protein